MTTRRNIILGMVVVVVIAGIGLGVAWLHQRQVATERIALARSAALAAVGAIASGNPDDINRTFDRPVPPGEATELASIVPVRVAIDSRPMLASFANPDGANRMVVEVHHPADFTFAAVVLLEAKSGGAGWRVVSVRRATAK